MLIAKFIPIQPILYIAAKMVSLHSLLFNIFQKSIYFLLEKTQTPFIWYGVSIIWPYLPPGSLLPVSLQNTFCSQTDLSADLGFQ